jgi:hypothetical protein
MNDFHYYDPGWEELELKDRNIDAALLTKIKDVLMTVIMKDFDNTIKYQAYSQEFTIKALADKESLIKEKFTKEDL